MPKTFQSVRSPDDTLTVHEYESQGFTHVAARCVCGRSTFIPFQIFRGPKDVPLRDLAPRLRCNDARCGKRGPRVYAWVSADLYLRPGTPHIDE